MVVTLKYISYDEEISKLKSDDEAFPNMCLNLYDKDGDRHITGKEELVEGKNTFSAILTVTFEYSFEEGYYAAIANLKMLKYDIIVENDSITLDIPSFEGRWPKDPDFGDEWQHDGDECPDCLVNGRFKLAKIEDLYHKGIIDYLKRHIIITKDGEKQELLIK